MGESPTFADAGEQADRVDVHLENFLALSQLTAEASVPEGLFAGVEEDLRVRDSVAESEMIVPERRTGTDRRAARRRDRREQGERRTLAERRRRERRSPHRGTARRTVPVPLLAVILVAVALVLSLTANALLTRSRPYQPDVALYLTGSDSAPDARGVLLYDGESVVLHAEGLAELSPGYRYVAWHATESGPTYLGPLTMLSRSTGRLLVDASEIGLIVSVTIESDRAPGAPSGPRVLVGLRDNP